jgi:hypothetical protein
MANENNLKNLRLAELIELGAMDELSGAQQAELSRILQQDPESRATFVKAIAFETMLAEEFPLERADPSLPMSLPVPEPATPGRWSWSVCAVLVSSAAILLLSWFGWNAVDAIREPDAKEEGLLTELTGDHLLQPIATVSGVWGGTLHLGQRLTTGVLEIPHGRAELTFDCGAVVAISGPAKINLLNEYRLFVDRGELSANVPPQAVGFVILTPTSHILDLGTSFALRVAHDGDTELHVAEGLVEATALATPNSGPTQYTKLESARFSKGSVERVEYDEQLFVSPTSAPKEQPKDTEMLHWSFDGPSEPIVDGSGTYALHLLKKEAWCDVPVVTEGVYGNGLRFNGRGGYAASSYPGIAGNQARTVAFWIRLPLPADPKGGRAIVSWGVPRFEEKWEVVINNIGMHGQVGAVRVNFGGGFVTGATDLLDGRWHHVAVVFHGGENADVSTHVKLYVDGRLEMTTGRRQRAIDTKTNLPGSVPVVLGRFIDERADWLSKYLIGDIDDLFIVGRAMSQHEVVRLKDKL